MSRAQWILIMLGRKVWERGEERRPFSSILQHLAAQDEAGAIADGDAHPVASVEVVLVILKGVTTVTRRGWERTGGGVASFPDRPGAQQVLLAMISVCVVLRRHVQIRYGTWNYRHPYNQVGTGLYSLPLAIAGGAVLAPCLCRGCPVQAPLSHPAYAQDPQVSRGRLVQFPSQRGSTSVALDVTKACATVQDCDRQPGRGGSCGLLNSTQGHGLVRYYSD